MRHAFLDSLKACARKKDLYQGNRIHADICANGILEKDPYLGNALVSMYAKCGAHARAQQVVDELPGCDVVAWTALIDGYVQRGQGQEALGCFCRMWSQGIYPNGITYSCLLKACGIMQDVGLGKQIHDEIVISGLLKKDVVLGNCLVDMYAKCGALLKAQQVFHSLSVRDTISWNALIAGYAQHGQGQEALGCFQKMRSQGVSPNAITYACALKACGITLDGVLGKQIHDDIGRQGFLKRDVILGGALVDMYAKCGMLLNAQQAFDMLPVRTAISWNALIVGYAQHGQGKEALGCFHQMRSQGVSPNAITYACALKACGIMQDVGTGKQIHDDIVSQGLLKKDVVLGNALVDMYAKCGVLLRAQEVFDTLPVRDAISWNALIAGYAQHGHGEEALSCFQCMQSLGISPNSITYVCTLKACGIMQAVCTGKQIHDDIISQGLLEKDVVLGNALLDMYAKCGALSKAQEVFNTLPVQNAISWTTLIAGYAQHGQGHEALGCFHRMQREGFAPNAITYGCVLKACGIMQDVGMGKQIHEDIINQGLLRKDIMLGAALIDMFSKCGALLKAQQVFDRLPMRGAASWTALIAGYAQHGQGQEALGCFHRMQSEGFSPNAITYACVLKACGIMQDVGLGKQIHSDIASQGLLVNDAVLGGALVDMYAKCGAVLKAREVSDTLPTRNAVSWNALIAGYAQHGRGQEALGCFPLMRSEGFVPDVHSWTALIGGYAQQGLAKEALDCFLWMRQEGVSPDAITFLNLLDACSHLGLTDEGGQKMCFDNTREKHGVVPPTIEHDTRMVDLFGCARHFEKAMRIIGMMPSADRLPAWRALLGACQRWGNVKLGGYAFERAVQAGPE